MRDIAPLKSIIMNLVSTDKTFDPGILFSGFHFSH